MRARFLTTLPLFLVVACSGSSAEAPAPAPTHPPPMAWRPLPEAPRNVGGPPESYTATVTAPPPSSSAPPADSVALVKGAIPDSNTTITGMQPDFAKCYQGELKKDPKAEGRTRVVVKVGADGKPTAVTPTQTDGLSDPLVACLVKIVEKAAFNPPVGAAGTLIIPISLKP